MPLNGETGTTPSGTAAYPVYQLNIVDNETGEMTPVNAKTCARAVASDEGLNMQEHLLRLYAHVSDTVKHITAEERAKWDAAHAAVLGDTGHTHAASDITEGTFAGQVVAAANGQTPGAYLIRNSKLSATEETPTVNGQICWQYE